MENLKITKRVKLLEVNNDMVHNYYYLIYGKSYNKDRTKYKAFRFIILFDVFDLQEYYEKDLISKKDIDNYITEYAYCFIDNNYIDYDRHSEFIKKCNETIKRFRGGNYE